MTIRIRELLDPKATPYSCVSKVCIDRRRPRTQSGPLPVIQGRKAPRSDQVETGKHPLSFLCSDDSANLFRDRSLLYSKETGIGMVFPHFGKRILDEYYENTYWQHRPTRIISVSPFYRGRSQVAYIRNFVAGSSIHSAIEFGAGEAALSVALRATYPKISTISVVERYTPLREALRRRYPFLEVLKDLDESTCRYDLFLSSHSLEHVHNLGDILIGIDAITRPGATLFFEVPNCNDDYMDMVGFHEPHTFYICKKGFLSIAGALGWQVIDVSEWGVMWSDVIAGDTNRRYFRNAGGIYLRSVLRK